MDRICLVCVLDLGNCRKTVDGSIGDYILDSIRRLMLHKCHDQSQIVISVASGGQSVLDGLFCSAESRSIAS